MSLDDTNSRPYQRILLKLSGESLLGDSAAGVCPTTLMTIAEQIKQITAHGIELGLVVGAGNYLRGERLAQAGINRVTADHMGMLATVMNALALRDALARIEVKAVVMSAISMTGVALPYDRSHACELLQQGQVVIFAAGTGNPLVTTDSAASLRGIEIGADVLIKATRVDGIYSADPEKDSTAERYTSLSYDMVLKRELGVMDLTAFFQCRDHQLPIRVLNIFKPKALLRAVLGEDEGTLVHVG